MINISYIFVLLDLFISILKYAVRVQYLNNVIVVVYCCIYLCNKICSNSSKFYDSNFNPMLFANEFLNRNMCIKNRSIKQVNE